MVNVHGLLELTCSFNPVVPAHLLQLCCTSAEAFVMLGLILFQFHDVKQDGAVHWYVKDIIKGQCTLQRGTHMWFFFKDSGQTKEKA